MRKIGLLVALLFPILCSAQTQNNDRILEELKSKIVGNSSMAVENQIYFDVDLRDKNLMCERKNIVGFVDEEGGNVNRFKEKWEMSYPESESKLSLTDFQNRTDTVARHLKNYCVSVNLGVLGDTYDDKTDLIYFGRSYSENPEIANRYANIYADSLRKAGILAGWKHFPSHTENIRIDKNNPNFRQNAWEQSIDTSPLSEILDRANTFNNHGHHDLLMISQTIYPAISDRPAVLSPHVVALAHHIQPNSKLMTDDLSELNLSDKDMIFIFKNYDYIMFLDGRQAVKFANVIIKAREKGEV